MYIKTNILFKYIALFVFSSLLLSAGQMGALSSNNYGSTQIGGTVYQELPVNGSIGNTFFSNFLAKIKKANIDEYQ